MDIYAQLRRDEGLRLQEYFDQFGNRTIGYGHKCFANEHYPDGITQEQAEQMLIADAGKTSSALAHFIPWSETLGDARKGCLQNMTYNMGIGKLLGFHHMLGFAETQDWINCVEEMKNSAWHTQVGARAVRLEEQMLTGEWQ